MGLLSGKNGKVLRGGAAVGEVTRWRLWTEAELVQYASSATGGFRRTLPGAKHGHGDLAFLLNGDLLLTDTLAVGDQVMLELYVDAARYFLAPAVIGKLDMTTDVSSGEAISGTVQFTTDGPWQVPGF
jgi:hypothetical protein